jgi:hypothetical protein
MYIKDGFMCPVVKSQCSQHQTLSEQQKGIESGWDCLSVMLSLCCSLRSCCCYCQLLPLLLVLPSGGAFGTSPLWHAVIRFPQRRQHLTLHYPAALFTSSQQHKQLVRSYCRLYSAAYSQQLEQPAGAAGIQVPSGGDSSSNSSSAAAAAASGGGQYAGSSSSSIASIVGAAAGDGGSVGSAAAAAAAYVLQQPPRAHRLVWVTSHQWVTGVLTDRQVEVYVTFDPLTDKQTGLQLAEQLKQLFSDKGRQQELLLTGV